MATPRPCHPVGLGSAALPVLRGRVLIEADVDPRVGGGRQAVTVTPRHARPTPAPADGLPEGPPEGHGKWVERLVFDSSVRPGGRVVKGTNLAADALLAELERGTGDEAMLRAHPELTPDDLRALRVYARVPEWIKRTAGAWADYADEVDAFVAEAYELRKADRPPLEP